MKKAVIFIVVLFFSISAFAQDNNDSTIAKVGFKVKAEYAIKLENAAKSFKAMLNQSCGNNGLYSRIYTVDVEGRIDDISTLMEKATEDLKWYGLKPEFPKNLDETDISIINTIKLLNSESGFYFDKGLKDKLERLLTKKFGMRVHVTYSVRNSYIFWPALTLVIVFGFGLWRGKRNGQVVKGRITGLVISGVILTYSIFMALLG